MTSRLETIQDFLILPIYISPNSIHYIFFKKHTSSKPDFIKDQTLFLLNIPVDTCTHHLDRLFRNCGDIKHVVYSTPTSTSSSLWLPFKTGSSCHVVFTSSDAVDKALSMLSRKRVWTIDEDVPEPRLYGIESIFV